MGEARKDKLISVRDDLLLRAVGFMLMMMMMLYRVLESCEMRVRLERKTVDSRA